MQRSTFWEHKDGFLYIFVHLHLKLNESKPQQNFFKQRSGSAPAESSVTMIRQDTKINIPWQPGLNLPYKVSQPPFRDRPQSLKNTVRGHLVCAGHGEEAVPCRQKPSTVQRRTSYTLGIGAWTQLLPCLHHGIPSHAEQTGETCSWWRCKADCIQRSVGKQSRHMIVLLTIFMYSYIFEHLSRFPCFKCLIHASPTLHPIQKDFDRQLLISVIPHYNSHLWE